MNRNSKDEVVVLGLACTTPPLPWLAPAWPTRWTRQPPGSVAWRPALACRWSCSGMSAGPAGCLPAALVR